MVNELLFLWAVALDREGKHDPSLRRKALEVCDLAASVRPARRPLAGVPAAWGRRRGSTARPAPA